MSTSGRRDTLPVGGAYYQQNECPFSPVNKFIYIVHALYSHQSLRQDTERGVATWTKVAIGEDHPT